MGHRPILVAAAAAALLLAADAPWVSRVQASAAVPGRIDTAKADRVGATDPDRLYDQRRTERDVRDALAIWQTRGRLRPDDAESAWKEARAWYWLGAHGSGDMPSRIAAFGAGAAAARRAAAAAPAAPEGTFWLAANLGARAERAGRREAMRDRAAIKRALEATLAGTPGRWRAPAERALGRYYAQVPAALGGSLTRAEQHYRAALAASEVGAVTYWYLADVLRAMGRAADATAALRAAVASAEDPDWREEDADARRAARAGLTSSGRSSAGAPPADRP